MQLCVAQPYPAFFMRFLDAGVYMVYAPAPGLLNHAIRILDDALIDTLILLQSNQQGFYTLFS